MIRVRRRKSSEKGQRSQEGGERKRGRTLLCVKVLAIDDLLAVVATVHDTLLLHEVVLGEHLVAVRTPAHKQQHKERST